jgi:predicted nucleic-acid-binding Zn-ribbon protein
LNKEKVYMQNQQLKLNISLDKTTPVTCENCGCSAFQPALLLRKASKFLTGTAQDGLVPIEIFCCARCGSVNSDFLPKELNQSNEQ